MKPEVRGDELRKLCSLSAVPEQEGSGMSPSLGRSMNKEEMPRTLPHTDAQSGVLAVGEPAVQG